MLDAASVKVARVSIVIDGFQIASGNAFRVSCPEPTSCAAAFGRNSDASIELSAWYQAAVSGDVAATKSFSLVVYGNDGAPLQRYHVESGLPVSYYENGQRTAIGFQAANIQRVAP
jgi:hypothetical protein